MASPIFSRALVLGGIRSGKSEFAETLVESAERVRYVATARVADADGKADPDWIARIEKHQARRHRSWTTTEIGSMPEALPDLLTSAEPAETLLIDDIGSWVYGVMEITRNVDLDGDASRLAAAIGACQARLVLVSPEVGLSVVPDTAAGRIFADAMGTTNRAISEACDAVVLVIAGNAMWLKGGP
jgi:nicotinate-nucleotide--dimethylbenzimidazole phosphoribosyltransferase